MNNEEKIMSMLETMQSDMKSMKNEQQKTNERLGRVDEKLGRVEERLDRVEKKLDFVSGSVMRLEHDVKLLADGHNMLNEKADRIEKHVASQDEVILKRVFPVAMEK